jgi:hypothetical protein
MMTPANATTAEIIAILSIMIYDSVLIVNELSKFVCFLLHTVTGEVKLIFSFCIRITLPHLMENVDKIQWLCS